MAETIGTFISYITRHLQEVVLGMLQQPDGVTRTQALSIFPCLSQWSAFPGWHAEAWCNSQSMSVYNCVLRGGERKLLLTYPFSQGEKSFPKEVFPADFPSRSHYSRMRCHLNHSCSYFSFLHLSLSLCSNLQHKWDSSICPCSLVWPTILRVVDLGVCINIICLCAFEFGTGAHFDQRVFLFVPLFFFMLSCTLSSLRVCIAP